MKQSNVGPIQIRGGAQRRSLSIPEVPALLDPYFFYINTLINYTPGLRDVAPLPFLHSCMLT